MEEGTVWEGARMAYRESMESEKVVPSNQLVDSGDLAPNPDQLSVLVDRHGISFNLDWATSSLPSLAKKTADGQGFVVPPSGGAFRRLDPPADFAISLRQSYDRQEASKAKKEGVTNPDRWDGGEVRSKRRFLPLEATSNILLEIRGGLLHGYVRLPSR